MATQLLFPNQPPQFLTAPSYVLGRGSDCDILLPEDDAGISRHHARLERDESGAWWLGDSSTNGTRVNGRKIEARHRLCDGDRVEIGAVQFSISAPQPARVAAVERALEIAPLETPRSSPTTITPRVSAEDYGAQIETPVIPAPIVQAQVRAVEIVEPPFTPAFAPTTAATPPAPIEPIAFAPIASAPESQAVAPSFEPSHFESAPYAPQPIAPVAAPQPPLAAPNPYAMPQNLAPQQSMAPAPLAPQPMMPLAPQPLANQKSPGLALLISFFFWGGGQLYNGQIGKGIGFMAGGFMLGVSTFLLGWIPVVGWFLGLMLLGGYIWNLVDAYGGAERVNHNSRQQQYNQQLQNQLNAQSSNAQLPR